MKKRKPFSSLVLFDKVIIIMSSVSVVVFILARILGKAPSWSSLLSIIGINLLLALTWHIDSIFNYLKKRRLGVNFLYYSYHFLPYLLVFYNLYTGVKFAEIYFKHLDVHYWYYIFQFLFTFVGLIFALVFNTFWLKEYFIKKKLDLVEIPWFLQTLIHIIMLFSFIYLCLFIIDKNSFIGVNTSSSFNLYVDFFYFSTVTFTTLGYGDIHAQTSAAKIIVSLEALFFTIGISIIIAIFLRNNNQETLDSNTKSETSKTADQSDNNP